MSARLSLRVSPGAARSVVVGRHGAGWKVRVAAVAQDGKANDAVVRLLADTLSLPARDVQIVSGRASRDKTVALEGMGPEEIERRLAQASGAGEEPKMSTIDTAEYRTKLEEEKARLLHAVGFLERENPGSISEELGEVADGGTDNHLADTATAMYDRELDEGLEEGARGTLAEIDAALQRIEDGTYGICESCGKPIGADRLSALPWTRLCIDDQRRAQA